MDICADCLFWFPAPVELHHDEAECMYLFMVGDWPDAMVMEF